MIFITGWTVLRPKDRVMNFHWCIEITANGLLNVFEFVPIAYQNLLVLLHSFVQKWLGWEFELKGVGDCGLVCGYFIFIEC